MTDFYCSAWRRTAAALSLALPALALPLAAWANCSRDIQVPVSQIGASVVGSGATVSGIYPEILRSLGAKMGCNFVFSVVPRARLEALYETGKADILIPASSTPRRDQHGLFIPLLGNRPLLISLQGAREPVSSMQELIERRELRVALLGGFGTLASYGLALWAMTHAPVAAVAALRETSIVFASLIALLVLREKINTRRCLSIALIAAGAVLMRSA